MRVGLATLHHGRRGHLERQAAAVREMTGLHRYLVVLMDDTPSPQGAEGLRLPVADPDRLPLSQARNLALERLGGCDLVIMLDVDCIPDPGLPAAYRAAASAVELDRSLLLGPVGWLDATEPARGRLSAAQRRCARTTVKRTFPASGVARECRPELFWSLSYAVSPRAHRSIGGFDEGFAGWGAEDTDYGRRAAASGIGLWKVAGAWAYHQPHPPARRTPGQIAAVVDNAERYRGRWGDWPMPDVLAELAATRRIDWTRGGTTVAAGEGPLA